MVVVVVVVVVCVVVVCVVVWCVLARGWGGCGAKLRDTSLTRVHQSLLN